MAEISYIFGDIITGAIIEEIALGGVSMTKGFGQGDFRGSFGLDQTGKNNRDLLAATQEGRCYLICERDSQPIWSGFIWTRTYQSQAKVFQIYAKSWEHYPEHRIIREDIAEVDVEQRNIFLSLWTSMMDDSNSPQFILPSSFATEVERSLTVKSFEFRRYRQAMDTIANSDDGFDWTIDVSRVGGVYQNTLRVGYPTLGATQAIHFDYSGDILNFWENGQMANKGTHFFGIGAGEGSTMLVQPVIHSDLVDGGFPRYDVDVSLKGITDSTILAGLTTQVAIVLKPGIPAFTGEIKGDLDPEFGSFGLGDAAIIHFDDPLHPDPIDQTMETRILGWEYYPPSDDHVEYARITFQGDE